jgi:6-phosphogluconate dehydrogenase
MRARGMSHADMAATFRAWGDGVLDSFLIDITAEILEFVDEDGSPLVERILDAAGQKGTGKWTVISSMELGQPVTLVAEAVFARIVSAFKDQRVAASGVLAGSSSAPDVAMDDIRDALYASKIVSYAQGFMLLDAASDEHAWGLDNGLIAGLWREGCIIRARFLDDIIVAYRRAPALVNLLLDEFFRDAVSTAEPGWRRTVTSAIAAGVPVPAYATALSFYDSYRSANLPANLIQAQRDYFGAHTYERTDRPRGEHFHTNWTGRGGETTSGAYSA